MRTDYQKEYYEKNKETCQLSMHNWYLSNKKGVNQRNKERYVKDKDAIVAEQRVRYQDNKDKILESLKIGRKRKRSFINFVALSYGCRNHDCRWTGDYVSCMLEFHHFDAKTKNFPLGRGSDYGWKAILDEINKCIILCASCHAMLHEGLFELSIDQKCNVGDDWIHFFKYEESQIVEQQVLALTKPQEMPYDHDHGHPETPFHSHPHD